MSEITFLPPEQYDALGEPAAMCDGGDLDCGSGLLLIIRNHFQPVAPGSLLEVRSREISVVEDLPAWCRMVGHTMLGVREADNKYKHFKIRKKDEDAALSDDMKAAKNYVWRTRVRWTEGMHGTAFVRNHSFPIGQPASFDTEDPSPSAIEYLLASLGGCLAVGFQWRCSQKGIEVRNLEVALSAKADNILLFLGLEGSGHPGLGQVEGKLYVDADAEDADLQALWEDTLARSPVTQSLLRAVPFKVDVQRVG